MQTVLQHALVLQKYPLRRGSFLALLKPPGDGQKIQFIKGLAHKHEGLSLDPMHLHEMSGLMALIYHPSTEAGEKGRSLALTA